MVKSGGGERESDGVVVLEIGVRNTSGGKGPDFDHVWEVGKCQGVTEVTRFNNPGKFQLVVAEGRLVPSPVKVRELQRKLWAAARQSSEQPMRAKSSGDVPVFGRVASSPQVGGVDLDGW